MQRELLGVYMCRVNGRLPVFCHKIFKIKAINPNCDKNPVNPDIDLHCNAGNDKF
jgi:hypothetical protein